MFPEIPGKVSHGIPGTIEHLPETLEFKNCFPRNHEWFDSTERFEKDFAFEPNLWTIPGNPRTIQLHSRKLRMTWLLPIIQIETPRHKVHYSRHFIVGQHFNPRTEFPGHSNFNWPLQMLHQLTSFHARCRKLFRRSKTSQEAKPRVPVSVNNWAFRETSFLIFEVVVVPPRILNLPTHFPESSQPFIHQKKLPAMLVALILSLPLLHTMMMMFLWTT